MSNDKLTQPEDTTEGPANSSGSGISKAVIVDSLKTAAKKAEVLEHVVQKMQSGAKPGKGPEFAAAGGAKSPAGRPLDSPGSSPGRSAGQTPSGGSSSPKRSGPANQAETPRKLISGVFVEFQPDAVELETQPIPGGLRWVLYTVAMFLLTTVAWAYWTKIETFVSAQGRLVPISEPIVIQAASGSPIKNVFFHFGDIVHRGDILATLDSTLPEADLESLGGRLNAAKAKLARLQAEQLFLVDFDVSLYGSDSVWVAEQSLFVSRKLAYESQLSELQAQLEGFDAQAQGNKDEILGLESALAIHFEVEEKMRKLSESGSQSVNNYLSQKLNRQEVELKIVNLGNKNKQLGYDREATVKRQQRVTADRNAEVNGEVVKTQNEIAVLEADLAKARRQKELSVLRVPDDLPYDDFYVLEASERTAGSVVRESDPLFKLMPLKDPLRIEAEIQGKDIGEIRMGDIAIIKLEALPYQKHGTLKGRLETISEGSFEKKEGMAESAFFKSFVSLDERDIENKPVNFRLVPGMTCTVEVRVGKRRVIDYFLYPLFRHLDNSLREPSQRGSEKPVDSDGKPMKYSTL